MGTLIRSGFSHVIHCHGKHPLRGLKLRHCFTTRFQTQFYPLLKSGIMCTSAAVPVAGIFYTFSHKRGELKCQFDVNSVQTTFVKSDFFLKKREKRVNRIMLEHLCWLWNCTVVLSTHKFHIRPPPLYIQCCHAGFTYTDPLCAITVPFWSCTSLTLHA